MMEFTIGLAVMGLVFWLYENRWKLNPPKAGEMWRRRGNPFRKEIAVVLAFCDGYVQYELTMGAATTVHSHAASLFFAEYERIAP